MEYQREIILRTAKTDHAGITDPIRKRPQGITRREWRQLTRKGYRATRKQELRNRREQAAIPETVKLDQRLHDAGLYSHRDMGRIRPVSLGIQGV